MKEKTEYTQNFCGKPIQGQEIGKKLEDVEK